MDDDDGYGSGLSGWAWHELGRQSELDHQSQAMMISAFAARLRGEVPVNVGAVISENQALWQQNQALFLRIRELETSIMILDEDYETLKAWGLGIQAKLRRFLEEQAS